MYINVCYIHRQTITSNIGFYINYIDPNLKSKFRIITGMQIIAQYIIHNAFIKRSIKMFAAVYSLLIKGQINDAAHVGNKYLFISHI